MKKRYWIGGGFAVLMLVGIAGQKPPAKGDGTTVTQEAPPSEPVKPEMNRFTETRLVKEAVRGRLKDPDSAEFRNVDFYDGPVAPAVCGEVNSKNGFGGYTGFQPFIGRGSEMVVFPNDISDSGGFNKLVKRLCHS